MTSIADPGRGQPVFFIVALGEAQPDGPYPDYSTLIDYNFTLPRFFRWNTSTELWEQVGEMAPVGG